MKTKKNYNCKDVNMVMAAQIIVGFLELYQADLVLIRSNWTMEYVNDLKQRIHHIIQNYVGLDRYNLLRQATSELNDMAVPAHRDLSFLKTQIQTDFSGSSENILKELGLTSRLAQARRGNQEALSSMLLTFRRGMTEDLKERIVSKGTNPELIERIIGYTDRVMEQNTRQEQLKLQTTNVSHEAREALNGLYNEIIGICKIASSYYVNDPARKNNFTFTQVIKRMNQHAISEPDKVQQQ